MKAIRERILTGKLRWTDTAVTEAGHTGLSLDPSPVDLRLKDPK